MIAKRPPMQALLTLSRVTLVAATLLAGACGHDVASPTAPTDADKALVGAVDQTYVWTVNPTQDSPQLAFGGSYVRFPANSICKIATSSYGPSYWTSSCVPETAPVVVTAIVRNAGTDHPSVDFSPAMRFNPAVTLPTLFFSVTNAATLSSMAKVKYCSNALLATSCIDESLNDSALETTVNTDDKTLWRKIRHFSGYVVAE